MTNLYYNSQIRLLDTNTIIDIFGRTTYDAGLGTQILDDWALSGSKLIKVNGVRVF